MDPVEPPPGKEKDNPAISAGRRQKSSKSHGGVRSLSTSLSWSTGRPRSRLPQKRKHLSKNGTLCPSGQYRRGDLMERDPDVNGLLSPHPNSMQQSMLLFLPPGERVLKSPKLHGYSDNDPNNSSKQSGNTHQIQPKKSSLPPALSPTMKMSTSQNNIGQSPRKTQLQLKKIQQEASASSPPNMGSEFQVNRMLAQPHDKDSDDDLNSIQSGGHIDLLKDLRQWKSTRKRSNCTYPLANVEQVCNSTTKKTRGQGEGLAIYEDRKQNHLKDMPAIRDNDDDLSNSNTKTTTTVACTNVLPNLYCGVSVALGGISVNGDLGCSSPPVIKANGGPHNNGSTMTEKIVCADTSGCNPPKGICDDHGNNNKKMVIFPATDCSSSPQGLGVSSHPGNSSTNMTQTVASQGFVSTSDGCIVSKGANCDILSTIPSMTQATTMCLDDVPSFTSACNMPQGISVNGDLGCSSPLVINTNGAPDNNGSTVTEKIVCATASGCNQPKGISDDHGNNNKKMVIFPAATDVSNSPRGLGVSSHPGNSNTNMTQTVASRGFVSTSDGCIVSKGASCDILNTIPSLTEATTMCLDVVPSFTSACNMPQGGSFATSTIVEDIPHKVISQGSDKIESTSASPCGIELAEDIIDPSQQGTSSPVSTSNPDFTSTLPKIYGPDLSNLNGNRSDDKSKKEANHPTSAMIQGIPHKLFPNVEGAHLHNVSEIGSCKEEIKKVEQERNSGISNISACTDSTNCSKQSGCILLDGDESTIAINANFCDGEITKDGKHKSTGKKNLEVYDATNEANDGMKRFNKELGIGNNAYELGGNVSAQQHKILGTIMIDTNNNDNNFRRDKGNTQNCVAARELCGTVLSCGTDSINEEDSILIPAENELIKPQQLISNEASRICQLSSTSGLPSLPEVNGKSSNVKFDVDLNIAHDEDLEHQNSFPSGASIDVNEPKQPFQLDLNIPYPVSVDQSSDGKRPADTDNLGARVEKTHHLTHVNSIQSQTNKAEFTNEVVNQTGGFMLFGKAIFQSQSSEIKHTSMQYNQIHASSSDMTSNMTHSIIARDGRTSYPSGPWSASTGVPVHSYHQSNLPTQMPYALVSNRAGWPFQIQRSALVNWRPVPYLNLTAHSTIRGVSYHIGPGNSNNLLNFDHASMHHTSRPQAPGPVTLSRTNGGEGSSRSNTRKGKEKIA